MRLTQSFIRNGANLFDDPILSIWVRVQRIYCLAYVRRMDKGAWARIANRVGAKRMKTRIRYSRGKRWLRKRQGGGVRRKRLLRKEGSMGMKVNSDECIWKREEAEQEFCELRSFSELLPSVHRIFITSMENRDHSSPIERRYQRLVATCSTFWAYMRTSTEKNGPVLGLSGSNLCWEVCIFSSKYINLSLKLTLSQKNCP